MGMRLNIPAGTAVRFEPGEKKAVFLVEYGGNKVIRGFNNLTEGDVSKQEVRNKALERAKEQGFMSAGRSSKSPRKKK